MHLYKHLEFCLFTLQKDMLPCCVTIYILVAHHCQTSNVYCSLAQRTSHHFEGWCCAIQVTTLQGLFHLCQIPGYQQECCKACWVTLAKHGGVAVTGMHDFLSCPGCCASSKLISFVWGLHTKACQQCLQIAFPCHCCL